MAARTFASAFLIPIRDADFVTLSQCFVFHQIQTILALRAIIKSVGSFVGSMTGQIHARNHARPVEI